MSHAATTWQSSEPKKACVLAGPCQPMPITPRLIRLLADPPAACLAKAGIAGRTAAEPAAFRKLRRLNERRFRASSERDCRDMIHLNITSTYEAATAQLGCAASFAPAWG